MQTERILISLLEDKVLLSLVQFECEFSDLGWIVERFKAILGEGAPDWGDGRRRDICTLH
jgi:hypothetical protein